MFKREDLIPPRMRSLPRDHRNYPVPYFVAWIDGKPDFRVIEKDRLAHCHNNKLCWLCGEKMGRYKAFVIGPMCSINRVSSEPPSHRECAEFAVKACPFLTLPKAERRLNNLPEDGVKAAGEGISHNPGATLVWVTETYKPFRVGHGVLFQVGAPHQIEWYAEGRIATRAEVDAAVAKGLPLLRATAESESPAAVAALERMYAAAAKLFPAAA